MRIRPPGLFRASFESELLQTISEDIETLRPPASAATMFVSGDVEIVENDVYAFRATVGPDGRAVFVPEQGPRLRITKPSVVVWGLDKKPTLLPLEDVRRQSGVQVVAQAANMVCDLATGSTFIFDAMTATRFLEFANVPADLTTVVRGEIIVPQNGAGGWTLKVSSPSVFGDLGAGGVLTLNAGANDVTVIRFIATGGKVYLQNGGHVSATILLTSPGTISGGTTIGSVLSVTGVAYSGVGVGEAWAWTRDGVDIPNATNPTYLLKAADLGKTIARRITLSNASGSVNGTTPGIVATQPESEVFFDPYYKSASVTLYDNNKAAGTGTVATPSQTNGSVRAAKAITRTSGKIYGEVLIPAGMAVNQFYVGLCPFGTTQTPGQGNLNNAGLLFVNIAGGVTAPNAAQYGAGKGLSFTAASGGTIRFAIDPSDGVRKCWFGTAAGWSNGAGATGGDPVAGTGGFDLPDFDVLYLQISPISGSGGKATLKSLRSEMSYAIPTGFQSYAEADAFIGTSTFYTSDSLVESIGINGHLSWRTTGWGQTGWKQPLQDLGIRHMRTQIGPDTNALADANELAGWGMDFLVQVAPEGTQAGTVPYYSPTTIAAHFAAAETLGKPKVRALAGANEANAPDSTVNWQSRVHTVQQQIWSLRNASTALSGVPVVMPSLFKRDPADITLLGGNGAFDGEADISDLHYYMSGDRPTLATMGKQNNPPYFSMRRIINAHKAMLTGTKPVYVTEMGVRTAQYNGGTDQYTPDPDTAAKYLIRLLFELINNGVDIAWIFTLFDDESVTTDEFGLLAKNTTVNFVKRAPYHSVRAVIELFEDRSPAFTPGGLYFTLSGNLSEIHYRAFQRFNGKYLLAIWNDAQTWDRLLATPAARSVPTLPVKLGLSKAATIRRKLLPRTATDTSWTTVGTNVQELTLAVPDEVAIYELTAAA